MGNTHLNGPQLPQAGMVFIQIHLQHALNALHLLSLCCELSLSDSTSGKSGLGSGAGGGVFGALSLL